MILDMSVFEFFLLLWGAWVVENVHDAPSERYWTVQICYIIVTTRQSAMLLLLEEDRLCRLGEWYGGKIEGSGRCFQVCEHCICIIYSLHNLRMSGITEGHLAG